MRKPWQPGHGEYPGLGLEQIVSFSTDLAGAYVKLIDGTWWELKTMSGLSQLRAMEYVRVRRAKIPIGEFSYEIEGVSVRPSADPFVAGRTGPRDKGSSGKNEPPPRPRPETPRGGIDGDIGCPGCGKRLRVNPVSEDIRLRCPACRTGFVVVDVVTRPLRLKVTHDPTGLAIHYAVLCLCPGCTVIELKEAFHKRMREYHPDKVAALGPELRRMAENKTKEINEAYERLRKALAP